MTKLSLSLESKNPLPQKGEIAAEIDQDHYKKAANGDDDLLPNFTDPELEINGANGLCIEEPAEALPLENHSSFEQEEEASLLQERKIDCRNIGSSKIPPLWGLVSICGRRREMEDSVIAMPQFARIPSYMLFDDVTDFSDQDFAADVYGVYDGHGGSQVANFCKERLHRVLAEEIEENRAHRGVVRYNSEARWRDIFASCFRRLDEEVGGFPRDVGGVLVNNPICEDSVGSTAVVAVVCSTHVVVGNCGDSRAVLGRGKQPVALSVDHKPEREDECARIEASGGRVINWDGFRVSGVLAVSRSIGDRYLRPYVIPDPEVTFVARTKEDECLVLASDGLWDVMTNKEACDLARRRLILWHKKKNGDNSNLHEEGEGRGGEGEWDPAAQEASEYLSKLALKRGSRDNISVIVVDLKIRRKKTMKKKKVMINERGGDGY